MQLNVLNPTDSKNLVYGLIDPNTNDLFYIGKTIQGLLRVRQHLTPSGLKNDGNTKKANKIRKLLENNQIPIVKILYQFNVNFDKKTCNEILYKKEQELIDFYNILGYELTNHQDGGPGSPGRTFSEATLKKMSERAIKRGLPQALKDQQKPKFNDPPGLRICSRCLIAKPLNEIRKFKSTSRECRVCYNKNRPNRKIPGARITYILTLGSKVKAKNIETNEEIIFPSMREAARQVGGKCSKTGIKNCIKNQTSYYGYIWSKI